LLQCFFFEGGSHYAVWAYLNFVILLPQLP
jgi:hypothetical protein